MKLPSAQKVLRPRAFLGLSIHDGSIRVAEVSTRDRVELVRAAELIFPAGVTLEAPEALGEALKGLLKQRNFSAKRAVVGVPARWLLTREKEVPPAATGLVGSALRLQAERDFSLDAKDLVLDFAGEADSKEPRKVLLAAMMAQHLERVTRLIRAAGLRLEAVTSSALALFAAAAAAPETHSGLFIFLAPGAIEVSTRERGVPRLLKHIPVRRESAANDGGAAQEPGVLAAALEARRVIALTGAGGEAGKHAHARLWDTLGLEAGVASDFAARLGVETQALAAPLPPGLASRLDRAQDARPFAAAAALAVAGARRRLLPLDFIHSRCSPPKRKAFGRRGMLGVAAGVALLIGGISFFIDLQGRAADLEGLKDHLANLGPDLQSAQHFADKVSFVMGWYDTRPPFLECLKQVTLAFPEEGRIWVTSITVNEGRKGVISGKTRDQKSILAVLDRLKGNGKLSEVKLSDMRDAGGSSGEISFALSFNFSGLE